MKNVCDTCGWQKNRKPDSWFCTKYGIPMRQPRIYCISISKEGKPHVQATEQVFEPQNRG